MTLLKVTSVRSLGVCGSSTRIAHQSIWVHQARIFARMGEQKIDLLIDDPGRSSHAPIFDLARRDGIPL